MDKFQLKLNIQRCPTIFYGDFLHMILFFFGKPQKTQALFIEGR